MIKIKPRYMCHRTTLDSRFFSRNPSCLEPIKSCSPDTLSCRNELERLQTRIESADESVSSLFTTVRSSGAAARREMAELADRLARAEAGADEGADLAFLGDLWNRMRAHSRDLRRRQYDYTRAVYSAYHGLLDPTLVGGRVGGGFVRITCL